MKTLFVFAGLLLGLAAINARINATRECVASRNVGASNRVFATSVGCCRSATRPFHLSGSSRWSRPGRALTFS